MKKQHMFTAVLLMGASALFGVTATLNASNTLVEKNTNYPMTAMQSLYGGELEKQIRGFSEKNLIESLCAKFNERFQSFVGVEKRPLFELMNEGHALEQMKVLPEALRLISSNIDSQFEGRRVLLLNDKINAVSKAEEALGGNLTDSIFASFMGSRLGNKGVVFVNELHIALGSQKTEFDRQYTGKPVDVKNEFSLYMYSAAVKEFLEKKKASESRVYKEAIENLLLNNTAFGYQDFSVAEVLFRENGSKAEFAGFVLHNSKTGQVIVACADGSIGDQLAVVGLANGFNLGLAGDARYFDQYKSLNPQIVKTMARLKAESDKPLTVVAVGENVGAANALQAVVNLKQADKNLNAGVLGFNLPDVYQVHAAGKVEELLGESNIVRNGEKPKEKLAQLVGMKSVGRVVKPVTEEVKPTPAAAPTIVEQTVVEQPKPGFFRRAWNGFKGWFGY